MFIPELGNLDFVIYLYDKVRMMSIPVNDQVLVLSTDNNGNLDEFLLKVKNYIKDIGANLELRKGFANVDNAKREILRNLNESGISEDMIADQLDLDVETVRLIIRESSKKL